MAGRSPGDDRAPASDSRTSPRSGAGKKAREAVGEGRWAKAVSEGTPARGEGRRSGPGLHDADAAGQPGSAPAKQRQPTVFDEGQGNCDTSGRWTARRALGGHREGDWRTGPGSSRFAAEQPQAAWTGDRSTRQRIARLVQDGEDPADARARPRAPRRRRRPPARPTTDQGRSCRRPTWSTRPVLRPEVEIRREETRPTKITIWDRRKPENGVDHAPRGVHRRRRRDPERRWERTRTLMATAPPAGASGDGQG